MYPYIKAEFIWRNKSVTYLVKQSMKHEYLKRYSDKGFLYSTPKVEFKEKEANDLEAIWAMI